MNKIEKNTKASFTLLFTFFTRFRNKNNANNKIINPGVKNNNKSKKLIEIIIEIIYIDVTKKRFTDSIIIFFFISIFIVFTSGHIEEFLTPECIKVFPDRPLPPPQISKLTIHLLLATHI